LAALLYAGAGALLSHHTAAWWWQLIAVELPIICVSAPGRRRSVPGVLVHHPRFLDAARHRNLPVTTVPRTLLDYASTVSFDRVRRALAEADYRHILNLEAMQGVLGCGRAASAQLSLALEQDQSQLALTRSVLEERFLALCEGAGIPLPDVKATGEGLMVDALWREQQVVVELDGRAAHRTPAQMERDHGRDLRLRAAGYVVLRYTWAQITRQPQLVVADLRARLGLEGSGRPKS